MHDFTCDKAEDMAYNVLRETVRYYKETKEGRDEMCEIMEDLRIKTMEKTRRETRMNDRREFAIKSAKVGLDEETIAEIVSSTVDQVRQWIASDPSASKQ